MDPGISIPIPWAAPIADKNKWTPLIGAAINGQLEAVEALW